VRRGPIIAAGWVGAVAAAAVFGLTTISALGAGAGPGGPLTEQEVSDRLAQTPPTTQTGLASPGPRPSPTTGAVSARQYFTTSGGGVWASCAGGQARLETMTPRQGFRLDGSDAGPATAAWVRFKQDVEHGHGTEYQVTITCVDGAARVKESADN